MSIFYKDEPQKERWESGQAILHKDSRQDRDLRKTEGSDREDAGSNRKAYGVKNSFGRLDYLEKGRKAGQDKEGLALEAFEAPGASLHTEKEKHLDRSTMKKIQHGEDKTFYASEIPLHNQALFYEMSGAEKSADFLECMKTLIRRQGHQTLQDAFGFLDQDEERQELKYLNENKNELLPEDFDWENKRIDALNGRLLRKEAKERQLCSELQIMLDARVREERSEEIFRPTQKEDEKQRPGKDHKGDDGFLRRQQQTEEAPSGKPEGAEAAGTSEEEEDT